MTESVAVSFQNVSFHYNSLPVLEQVSFSIAQGEFVSIVGPNGGGKTTLLKLILGLLRPGRGTVLVQGKSPQQVKQRIGYMTQHLHFDPQFPISVIEIVLMGRLGRNWRGSYTKGDRQAALEALELVGLADMSQRLLYSLSGGQQQRVLLARALVEQPQLLLLDEPTASVDVPTGRKLYEILQDLNKQMTILLVSHDLGLVSKMVQKVLCVNRTVVIHPTSAIDGEIIQQIYGCEMNIVRHDADSCHEDHHHG